MHCFCRRRALSLPAVLASLLFSCVLMAQDAPRSKSQSAQAGQPILAYIQNGWHTLTRSTNECASFTDTKLRNSNRVLYLPADMEIPATLQSLPEQCDVTIRKLPTRIARLGEIAPEQLPQPGLLYLPNPYVVPGGRFNEMYGWDSYFIIRGLLENGELELARGMVENFFFEIEHYGAVLNANRTYYLTRSQPPFLSSMILAVHEADKSHHRDDSAWLARAYGFAVRDHALWIAPPKLNKATGLSRYYDFGSGPVPEIGDHGDYYQKVVEWLVQHPEVHTGYLTTDAAKGTGPAIKLMACATGEPCKEGRTYWLTPEFYHGDRAMRESGFDISFRFGPFSGSTADYAPVCLNSLLYKLEKDLAAMAAELGKPADTRRWNNLAAKRKQLVNRYLWSEKRGLYLDYNLREQHQSDVLYASIFYPLWSGLASAKQARAVLAHLHELERPGGIAMSGNETGVQWDLPYGWAPIQVIAVEGMQRYGYRDDANRVARKFLTMVAENERKDGVILEKYNVVNRTTAANVTAGYANVTGFGWTNGAFLVMLHQLPGPEQTAVLEANAAEAVH